MEIIKHGDPEKIAERKAERVITFNCNHCGCIFTDGEKECTWHLTKHNNVKWRHTCPDCDGIVYSVEYSASDFKLIGV